MKKYMKNYQQMKNELENRERFKKYSRAMIIFLMVLVALSIGAGNMYRENLVQYRELQEEIQFYQEDNAQLMAIESSLEKSYQKGIASWYDYDLKESPAHSKTHATAATRDFPRYSYLMVCSLEVFEDKQPCIIVYNNDYGPDGNIHPDRVIDLSSYAYSKLAPLGTGTMEVEVMLVK